MVVCPFGFGVARAALISFLLLAFSKHAAFEGHFYPKQDGREIEGRPAADGHVMMSLGHMSYDRMAWHKSILDKLY